MLKAKLGMSPIAWWNDDLAELSDDVSLEECLRQSRSAGFTGMEKGRRFPEDPKLMLPILKKADVTLCGGWFSGTLTIHIVLSVALYALLAAHIASGIYFGLRWLS